MSGRKQSGIGTTAIKGSAFGFSVDGLAAPGDAVFGSGVADEDGVGVV